VLGISLSDVKTHALQGVAASVLLYPFLGRDALVVGASMVAIDADHALECLHATGKLTLSGIYRLRDLAHIHMHEIIGLNIFHTLECHLCLLLLGLYVSPKFMLVLLGFMLHHIFDQIYLARLGYPFVRALSVLEYYVRSRHLITMKQLARKYGL